jgi:MoaA/NifB/PqqE/SkfB family radical SAM enzyme
MPVHEVGEAYRLTRARGVNTDVLCHAPFVSLNFGQNGTVTSCCYNRRTVLGRYPEDELAAIWDGHRARAFRDAFLQDAAVEGCGLCFHQLRVGNFGGALMRQFDRFAVEEGYQPRRDVSMPRVLEFEIANTCNLECVMCEGRWSSAIRANREGLPPLRSPYDDAFVEQLAPFLPSIRAAKFLGGEPFLISRYYDIWERLLEVNPDAQLTVTTNGTRLPGRARALLERLRFNIVVSLDSLDPATFEQIRLGARFEEVMANVAFFADYTARRGTDLALAVCPMQSNWRGLPDLARFCADRRIWIHFNTVTRPREASLASLPVEELGRVIACLEQARPKEDGDWGTPYNLQSWDGLVNQLRSWHTRKLAFSERSRQIEREVLAGLVEDDQPPVGAARSALRFVVGCYGASQNLAAVKDEPIELAGILAAAPGVDEGSDEFGPFELLRAVHRLHRVVYGGAPGTNPSLALDQCIEAFRSDGAVAESLGRWLKGRLSRGEWEATARWLRALLNVAGHADRWRRVLDEGIVELRARGLGDEECAAVGRYLAGIVPFAPVPWPIDLPVRLPGDGRHPGVHEADLERVFDAMYLFHRGDRPVADQEAFRQRLDEHLDLIGRSGLKRALCASLTSMDLLTVFDTLVDATDEVMAALLEQLRASPWPQGEVR